MQSKKGLLRVFQNLLPEFVCLLLTAELPIASDLKVSSNRRYLEKAVGTPFLWTDYTG